MDNGKDVGRPSLASLKDGGEIVAMNCPNCGVGVGFGQGSCGHCGSGLMRKVGDGPKRFNMPNDAKEFVRDEKTRNMDLRDLVKHMVSTFSKPEDCAYVMWRNAPLFVGKGIGEDESVKNWQQTLRTMEREELGGKWTKAVSNFGELLKDMESMPDDARIDAGYSYVDSFGKNRMLDSESIDQFFRTPSFDNFESITKLLPGGRDEADLVNIGVSHIRKFIPTRADTNS